MCGGVFPPPPSKPVSIYHQSALKSVILVKDTHPCESTSHVFLASVPYLEPITASQLGLTSLAQTLIDSRRLCLSCCMFCSHTESIAQQLFISTRL